MFETKQPYATTIGYVAVFVEWTEAGGIAVDQWCG